MGSLLDKVRADKDRASEESRAKGQAEYDKFSREAAELGAQAMERTGLPGSDIAAAMLRSAAGNHDAWTKMGSEPGKLPGGLGGADGVGVGTPKAGASIEKLLPGTGMLMSGSAGTKFGEGVNLDLKLGLALDGGRGGGARNPMPDGATELPSRPLTEASAEKRDRVTDFINSTLRH
ncbi:hypothetical protein GKQ77_27990 [Streptomyces sp. BG9H]|uniref:Uncharacterized protein n=1 Tax=Streptomyces anatolicus TaxID=2675858 RepID=A0ABS6YV94_9ACTN|nr:hypothetical protein [Streptomyces anatolicus]MBW5425356.1 hypothetical protein [Streptomyces anatolicus]